MDTNQYMEMFLDESREHLQSLNDGLLSLESNPADLSVLNEIFRNAVEGVEHLHRFFVADYLHIRVKMPKHPN